MNWDVCFSKYISLWTHIHSQRGLRKGYDTQHYRLAMLEEWKAAAEKEKPFWA